MTLAAAISDVRELERNLGEEFAGRLRYDFSDDHEVRIDGFAFPEGWQNRSGGRYGSILIELPETYPEHPPRVFITDDMRYEGSRPAQMAPGRVDAPAEWAALEVFPKPESWDASCHSLVTVFEHLHAVLESPDVIGEAES
jgi:hypothetical protein